jgi:hypothetical protein
MLLTDSKYSCHILPLETSRLGSIIVGTYRPVQELIKDNWRRKQSTHPSPPTCLLAFPWLVIKGLVQLLKQQFSD